MPFFSLDKVVTRPRCLPEKAGKSKRAGACVGEMRIVERSRGRRRGLLANLGTPLALPLLLSLALTLPWHSLGASDCFVTAGARSFDLSELAGAVRFKSKAPDSFNWFYSFSACGAVAAVTSGWAPSCASSPPSAVLQQTQSECKGLGAPDTRIVTTTGNGLALSFSGGDSGRSVLIEIECADVMWPQVVRWGHGAAPGSYAALVRARAGCALACARTSEGAVCGGEANGACRTGIGADISKCTCNVGRAGAACAERIHAPVAIGTATRISSGGLDFFFIALCTFAIWLGSLVFRFVLLADSVSAADSSVAALSGASSCLRAVLFAMLSVGLFVALSARGAFQGQTHYSTTFAPSPTKTEPSPTGTSQECLKAFPGIATTWGNDRGSPKPTHKIPIYIISFNNPTFLKRMLFQAACFNAPTVVVDNDSDFLPHKKLLGELNRSGVPVYRLQNKGAHTIFSDPSLFESLPPYFAVSDADIKFNPNLPMNFLEVMAQLCGALGTKVGFAIDTSNPKLHGGAIGQHIRDWEEKFWKETLDFLNPLAAFNAQIDTTFAVYSKARALERQACTKAACNWFDYDAVRLAGNFTSEHTPWLADFYASWDPAEIAAAYGDHGVSKTSGSSMGNLMREHNLTSALSSSPSQQGA
jgi:hypothetical protein